MSDENISKLLVRIVSVDYYLTKPIPKLKDACYSGFRSSAISYVPVIRIFGPSSTGVKTCIHIHGVFPYMFVPNWNQSICEKDLYQFAVILDKAINTSLAYSSAKSYHVYRISTVLGKPFYGFHEGEKQFLKIEFFNPSIVKRAADLLQNGAVFNIKFQPYEAHVPYILQFFIDNNLYGMNYVALSSYSSRSSDDISDKIQSVEDVTKQSYCTLEVDAAVGDIVSLHQNMESMPSNPGLAFIWEEENRRRRILKESSQNTITLSQDRPERPFTRTETFFRNKISEKLFPYKNSSGDDSFLQQSQGSEADSEKLNTQSRGILSLLEKLMEEKEDTKPNVSRESSPSVIFSDEDDGDDIFIDRSQPALRIHAEDDSILGDQFSDNEIDDIDHFVLSQSISRFSLEKLSSDESDTENCSKIPQLDGATSPKLSSRTGKRDSQPKRSYNLRSKKKYSTLNYDRSTRLKSVDNKTSPHKPYPQLQIDTQKSPKSVNRRSSPDKELHNPVIPTSTSFARNNLIDESVKMDVKRSYPQLEINIKKSPKTVHSEESRESISRLRKRKINFSDENKSRDSFDPYDGTVKWKKRLKPTENIENISNSTYTIDTDTNSQKYSLKIQFDADDFSSDILLRKPIIKLKRVKLNRELSTSESVRKEEVLMTSNCSDVTIKTNAECELGSLLVKGELNDSHFLESGTSNDNKIISARRKRLGIRMNVQKSAGQVVQISDTSLNRINIENVTGTGGDDNNSSNHVIVNEDATRTEFVKCLNQADLIVENNSCDSNAQINPKFTQDIQKMSNKNSTKCDELILDFGPKIFDLKQSDTSVELDKFETNEETSEKFVRKDRSQMKPFKNAISMKKFASIPRTEPCLKDEDKIDKISSPKGIKNSVGSNKSEILKITNHDEQFKIVDVSVKLKSFFTTRTNPNCNEKTSNDESRSNKLHKPETDEVEKTVIRREKSKLLKSVCLKKLQFSNTSVTEKFPIVNQNRFVNNDDPCCSDDVKDIAVGINKNVSNFLLDFKSEDIVTSPEKTNSVPNYLVSNVKKIDPSSYEQSPLIEEPFSNDKLRFTAIDDTEIISRGESLCTESKLKRKNHENIENSACIENFECYTIDDEQILSEDTQVYASSSEKWSFDEEILKQSTIQSKMSKKSDDTIKFTDLDDDDDDIFRFKEPVEAILCSSNTDILNENSAERYEQNQINLKLKKNAHLSCSVLFNDLEIVNPSENVNNVVSNDNCASELSVSHVSVNDAIRKLPIAVNSKKPVHVEEDIPQSMTQVPSYSTNNYCSNKAPDVSSTQPHDQSFHTEIKLSESTPVHIISADLENANKVFPTSPSSSSSVEVLSSDCVNKQEVLSASSETSVEVFKFHRVDLISQSSTSKKVLNSQRHSKSKVLFSEQTSFMHSNKDSGSSSLHTIPVSKPDYKFDNSIWYSSDEDNDDSCINDDRVCSIYKDESISSAEITMFKDDHHEKTTDKVVPLVSCTNTDDDSSTERNSLNDDTLLVNPMSPEVVSKESGGFVSDDSPTGIKFTREILHSTPTLKKSKKSPSPTYTPIYKKLMLKVLNEEEKSGRRPELTLENIEEEMETKIIDTSSNSMIQSLEKSDVENRNKSSNSSHVVDSVGSGRIDVTMNDTYGFKIGLENLQEGKTVAQFQLITVMSMELFTVTRLDLNPDPEFDAISCIFYSVFHDKPASNALTSGMIIVDPDASRLDLQKFSCHKRFVQNEDELLNIFIEMLRLYDPDILLGYEIEMLSWGYLIQRSQYLDRNFYIELSRVKDTKVKEFKDKSITEDAEYVNELKLVGRIVLNVWRLMRHEIALQSYTFENIMFHIMHQRVSQYTFLQLTDWWNDSLKRWIVVDYYLFRVENNILLLQQLDFFSRTGELAKLFGIQFFEVLSRGSQFRVESMMLRLAKTQNYVAMSPSPRQRAAMRAPESLPLIMEPESKYYREPVIVLDFQSLYPSIIIAYNYCFSTCLGRVQHLVNNETFEFGCAEHTVPVDVLLKLESSLNVSPCGVAFVNKDVRRGILPAMLEEILETRLMVKKSMKQNKDNKILQRVLHARQLGLKLIANVTYGYTSANFSGRMPCIEVGDSVVSKGRETLERAIELISANENWQAKVIYGDTDSLFVMVPGRTKEQAFRIGSEIVDAVTNENPKPVKLKLEKVYYPCILQTKKRYVGYMYESVDQKEPVYDAKGIETVRRDGCPAVAKILEKSLKLVFETNDSGVVKRYVQRQFSKLISGRLSVQELTFAREYRGMNNYKPAACVPALQLAKQALLRDRRSEPRVKERVRYILIAGPPGVPLIRLVRTPQQLLDSPGCLINAEYYITRAIIPALERCFALMNVNVQSWYTELPRKKQLHLPIQNDVCLRNKMEKKKTIFQYFFSSKCICCGEVTMSSVCKQCERKPQELAIVLGNLINKWQQKHNYISKVCQSCCANNTIECISLDCPTYYVRRQTLRDVEQVHFVEELQHRYLRLPSKSNQK